jgi:orotidine-5'-phosphate decarboxylase
MENLNSNKIILALDNFSVPYAEEVISQWQNKVRGFKLNHNLYPYIGKNYNNIFCDYKLFDIPNTMCGIIEQLINNGCEMVTIHMSNNSVAIKSLQQYSKDIKLLGVTVLTSWEYNDVNELYKSDLFDCYRRSIDLMEENNFYGMICSPLDIKLIHNTALKKICPGIRSNPTSDDQVRSCTAEEAFSAGADYLVMGRSFFNNI